MAIDLKWLRMKWLLGRSKERDTIELFKALTNAMAGVKPHYLSCSAALMSGDYARLKRIVEEVKGLENKGDELSRKIARELYTGAFMPAMRTRLYCLADAIDDVIDVIEDAVAAMVFLQRGPLPEEILRIFVSMIQEGGKAIDALQLVVCDLFAGGGELDRHVKEAGDAEHALDVMKKQVLEKVLLNKEMDPVMIWQVCHVADLLSAVGDVVEDCCDNVAVLRLVRLA